MFLHNVKLVGMVVLLCLFVVTTALCEQGATADDGSRVTLRDDNTWVASNPAGNYIGVWIRDFLASSTAIPFLLSLAANVVGLFAFFNTRRAERRRFMESLMSEYQSPQMHLALESMFEFRKRFVRISGSRADPCGVQSSTPGDVNETAMCKAYHRELSDARRKLRSLHGESRGRYISGMLHYQRRMISHFLQRMDWLIRHRGLTGSDVAAYWPSGSLRELTELLAPLRVDPKETMDRLVHEVSFSEGRTGVRERWLRFGKRALLIASGVGLGLIISIVNRLV